MNINARPTFRTATQVDTAAPYVALQDVSGALVLDGQMGVFPPLTVPPVAAPALTCAAGERLFAVIDAGLIPGLADRLSAFDAPSASILAGAAEEELQDIAFYIADVTDDPRLLRALFTDQGLDSDLGGRDAAIFIRAATTLEALRRHLRRFTRACDANGKWFFFRLFSAPVLFHYLASPEPNPVNLSYLFEPRGFDALTFVIPLGAVLRTASRTQTLGHRPGHVELTRAEFDAMRMGPWLRFVAEVETALDTAGLRPPGMTNAEIASLCHEGFGRGFRIELALYTYVRARCRARITGQDFDAVGDALRARSGKLSQLDFARALDRALGGPEDAR